MHNTAQNAMMRSTRSWSLVRTRIGTRSTKGATHVTVADRVETSLAAKLEPDAFGSDLRHGVYVERRLGIARAER